MSTMTLLEMTQSIMSSMGSDPVNSISDTYESTQVADILKQTYYNMLGRYDLPEHNQLVQLLSSGSPQQPTLMYMPAGISRIEWVKYYNTNPTAGSQVDQFGSYRHDLNLDIVPSVPAWTTFSTTSATIQVGPVTFTVASGLTITVGQTAYCYTGTPPAAANSMMGTVTSYSGTTLVLNITAAYGAGTFNNWLITSNPAAAFGPGYQDVPLVTIDDFFDWTNQYDLTETDVGSYQLNVIDNATGVPQNYIIKYKNSIQPQMVMILSNNYVIFDSYDSTQDTSLQPSKTMTMAWSIPSWSMTDAFIPNIDEQHFPLMLNDAKSLAFTELKQMPHQKAEDEVARQLVSLQKWKAISGKPSYFAELPNFGRSGGGFWGPLWREHNAGQV